MPESTSTSTPNWAQETWGRLLDIANTAVGNITERNQPAPAPTTSWWSRLDAKQVALYVVGGLLVILIAKKFLK